MKPIKWLILLTLLLGFVWPALWWVTIGLFEFGLRHGRDVAALWLEGRIRRYRDD